jgi:hypothetical protein
MPAPAKKSKEKSVRTLKKSLSGTAAASGPKIKSGAVKTVAKNRHVADVNTQRSSKIQHTISPIKSIKNLAVYLKRLEKENSILARELIEKKERRLRLPILNPEDTRMTMARLNLRITETESMMAHQKQGLQDAKGFISTQEKRMKDIALKINSLQNDVTKKVIQPHEAKLQLEGLLQELQKLRSRREETLAGLAV